MADWAGRKTCKRKEFESLVGHLNHTCKDVRPGQSFLRRMIVHLQQYGNRYHTIRCACVCMCTVGGCVAGNNASVAGNNASV